MQYVAALDDHMGELAGSLESIDARLRTACEQLRDVGADDVGPVALEQEIGDVVARLGRRLEAVAQEAADGALAVRRHLPAGRS